MSAGFDCDSNDLEHICVLLRLSVSVNGRGGRRYKSIHNKAARVTRGLDLTDAMVGYVCMCTSNKKRWLVLTCPALLSMCTCPALLCVSVWSEPVVYSEVFDP